MRWTGLSQASKDAFSDPYYNHYRYMEGFIGRVMRLAPATTESVARTVVRTIHARHPRLRVQATLDAYLFMILRRLVPQHIYHAILYRALPNIEQWGPNARILPPGT